VPSYQRIFKEDLLPRQPYPRLTRVDHTLVGSMTMSAGSSSSGGGCGGGGGGGRAAAAGALCNRARDMHDTAVAGPCY